MKTQLSSISQILLLVLTCYTFSSSAQVGIGTSTPEGALDVKGSNYGLLYPRFALTSTTTQAPVSNPAGGGLAVGTAVYNTNLSTNGANDVSPGVYVWDGSEWLAQHIREDHRKFEQDPTCQRTTIRESYSNPEPTDVDLVLGLDNETFIPKYSGTYRVEVKTNFGAGAIADFTGLDDISLATAEGAFFFTMSGTGINIDPTSTYYDYTEGWIYTHAYATHNEVQSPAIEDNIVPHFATVVYHLYLLAGHTYNFSLSNSMYTGDAYFVNGGDSGTGQGHIGHEIPCTVEFTYLGT